MKADGIGFRARATAWLACWVLASAAAALPVAAQDARIAFATDLVCGGQPARFGVADDVPVLEFAGRRHVLVQVSREAGRTTFRTPDGGLTFQARGRTGVIALANGRRLACRPSRSRWRPVMASSSGVTDGLAGGWRVTRIEGAAVGPGVTVTMEFDPSGQVSGRSGCNRYAGPYAASDGRLSFGNLIGTRMACPPAQMDTEQRFTRAVRRVTDVRLTNAGELQLLGGGRVLLLMDRIR